MEYLLFTCHWLTYGSLKLNKTFLPAGKSHDIAVIGSGIAGLSAAWLLSQFHRVTIYEKDDRAGGHANTVNAMVGGERQQVDTGFIVYNEENYPNLVAFFNHLGVPTQPSNMSFAVSINGGAFEYGSSCLDSMLGQRRNIVRPTFWRLVRDIRRFYAEAPEIARFPDRFRDMSLGSYLAQGEYGEAFVDTFILPMGAAIWSTRSDEVRDHPVEAFVRFFESHGLLRFSRRIPWRTVTGGSWHYVRRITASFGDRLRTGEGVVNVRRDALGVDVRMVSGQTHRHDAIVIAAHADQALALLGDADRNERRLLGAFRYTKNRAVLHSDPTFMPQRRRVWSSWNYLGDAEAGVSLTYWMNRLQGIDECSPLFVTVNPKMEPAPDLTHRVFEYEHPFFDATALGVQKSLWELQGCHNTWFCGSYFGHGFHEDALQSGLAAAESIGSVRRPWTVPDESGRIALAPNIREFTA
jgi:predicted NAD/FAD-binding protein